MIRPTRKCVFLLGAETVLAILPTVLAREAALAWVIGLVGTIGALAFDAALGLLGRDIDVEIETPERLHIGAPAALTVTLKARRLRRSVPIALTADVTGPLASVAARVATIARDTLRGSAELALVPTRRGPAVLDAVWLRWHGPFGLIERIVRIPVGRPLPVLPNLPAVRAAALRFFSTRDPMSGLKVERYIGDGSEFDALREWAPGFDTRAIHWKASARHHRLQVREFRAERNHNVVIALDSGRLMGEPLDGIPKLDHAVNAALLLAYGCLKTGDRVGLYAFDDRARLWSEGERGVGAMGRLQERCSQIAYSDAETNFTLGLFELGRRLKRRSLIVVLTDFVDSVTAQMMIENLGHAARRHLVVFAALRDRGLDDIAQAELRDMVDISRAVTAGDMMREREKVLLELGRRGVQCLDAEPRDLGPRLLNKYLDIKRRELV